MLYALYRVGRGMDILWLGNAASKTTAIRTALQLEREYPNDRIDIVEMRSARRKSLGRTRR